MANASGFYTDPAYVESVSNVTASPSVQNGAIRVENGDVYRYVYNDCNSQIIPGLGVIISSNSGFSVTLSSTTNSGGFFGIVHNATLTTGTYGWVMTAGFCKIKAPAGSGIVAGAALGVGADGVVTDVPVTGVAAAIQGFCTTATASAGVGLGYMRLFG